MSAKTVRQEFIDIIKIVFPIAVTIIGSAWKLSNQLDNMERFGWTLHDQREWARQVHALNPTVIVPDPNEIFWSRRPDTRVLSISPDALAKGKP